jgi:hypothetical protein
MALIGRHFGLSETRSGSISCSADGVFVGEVPLLERPCCRNDFQQWQPRHADDLNRDLTKRYRLPVDITAKVGAPISIARALNRGDLFHAQIVALHLQFPDPPALTKTAENAREIVELARQLGASNLLKGDWDPLKHPRWPAGSPGSIGGEFAPRGNVADNSVIEDRDAPVIPVQITLPAPPDLVIPRGAPLPWPSEIAPAPFAPPDVSPITIPRNPYPGRPKCVAEWAEATEYCIDLWTSGQMGKDYNREQGRTVSQCIMGRVSQDCGGNGVDA